jgi:hypothetical protein
MLLHCPRLVRILQQGWGLVKAVLLLVVLLEQATAQHQGWALGRAAVLGLLLLVKTQQQDLGLVKAVLLSMVLVMVKLLLRWVQPRALGWVMLWGLGRVMTHLQHQLQVKALEWAGWVQAPCLGRSLWCFVGLGTGGLQGQGWVSAQALQGFAL